jgi:glutaredoxin
MAEATLYTRHNCHLCERAEAILRAIAADHPMTISRVDVDTDPSLAARYGQSVPVIVVDGRVLAEARVSEYRLRRLLGVPPTPRAWVGLARSAFSPARHGETDRE